MNMMTIRINYKIYLDFNSNDEIKLLGDDEDAVFASIFWDYFKSLKSKKSNIR